MKDRFFYSVCFFLIFIFGVLKVLLFPTQPPLFFENQVGEKAEFSGIVVDDPEHKENNQKLVVEVKEGKYKTKVIATVPLAEEFGYGDEIIFSGKLEKPENFVTNTGKEFDYINYLAKDGIFYLVNYPKTEVVSSGRGNKINRFSFTKIA
jgi:co-chaperonin GroES (HSP10)